ncbi:unnamed protein product [Musa acuminata subsp. malaccensis]|uniref:(wild Malaysian banana) hypothetical protein n=1 Tax=Musa acuminata subsp. malaccensis TaxID=214687 RepID=A0A804HU42_MUSAM|nr:PREDICTED: uncharacterized protein LOC103991867 [Musa acuminata subsp. malaccensis]CAG1859532.1 unnamed protein product [Musa acuminata subsp. malaccensis]
MAETEASAGEGGGLGYADSLDSCDEPPFSSAGRLRLMCSYGGRIVPRPTEKSLCYLGGETRIVVVDRHSALADICAKLSRTLLGGRTFSLKYQLPSEDLDSLISVATDEDLDNMIDEYDRVLATSSAGAGGGCSSGSSRLRLFLFPSKPEMSPASSIGTLLDDSKSETWFVDALNSVMGGMEVDGLPRGLSSDSASVNCLLGLEEGSSVHSRSGAAIAACSAHSDPPDQLALPSPDSSGKLARHGHDLYSVPDSPMLDSTSSFGSASSAPSLSNLPPIRVRPDDRLCDPGIAGLDDHFAHINLSASVATGGQRLQDDFKEPSYAPQLQLHPLIPFSASSASTSPTEYRRIGSASDDEKSDRGAIWKPQRQPPKPTEIDASISDPVSRAMYLNATSDQKRELSVFSDPSYGVPIPATNAASYRLPSMQPERFQQQQLYPQLQLQQQYIPGNPHYIHHPSAGGVIPVPSYFPIAAHTIQQSPQAHPHDPQIPLYYYPVQPTPSYNLAAVQPGMGDPNSLTSAAKPPMAVPQVPAKPELPASLYRTAALQPQLIHMAADQPHSYAGMGYRVVQHHHVSQSPATVANHGYEFAADQSRPQMYHSQATPSLASTPQCQPPTSGIVIIDAMAQADTKATRAS